MLYQDPVVHLKKNSEVNVTNATALHRSTNKLVQDLGGGGNLYIYCSTETIMYKTHLIKKIDILLMQDFSTTETHSGYVQYPDIVM